MEKQLTKGELTVGWAAFMPDAADSAERHRQKLENMDKRLESIEKRLGTIEKLLLEILKLPAEAVVTETEGIEDPDGRP